MTWKQDLIVRSGYGYPRTTWGTALAVVTVLLESPAPGIVYKTF